MRRTLPFYFLAASLGLCQLQSSAVLLAAPAGNESADGPPTPAQGPVGDAPTVPKKVPPCGATEMADRLKSSFDSSDGAISLNVSALSVRDAAEVDPTSLLAIRLNRAIPPRADANVAVYCKAHIELNTGHTVAQVFRIDVQPATGQETLMEMPIYDSDFDMRVLSEKPAPEEPAPGPNPAISPGTKPPIDKHMAPQGSILGQRALPVGTVLCTLEGHIAPSGAARGISCFKLTKPTPFVLIASSQNNHQQVRLTGGDRAGTIAWTEVPADGR